MDLERTYKNTRLEARRKQLLNQQQLVATLRNNKRGKRSAVDDVNDALDGPRAAYTPRAKAIARAVDGQQNRWRPDDQQAALRLFRVIAEKTRLLEDDPALPQRLHAIVTMLAERKHWIRDPDAWVCRTHNAARQFSQLARHLFARYDVPAWMDQVWFDRSRRKRGRGRAMWFVYVGQGGNLRKADGLPIAMTKLMAHHAVRAPAGVTIEQALRYGQTVALGVEPSMVRAVLGSRLGNEFGTAGQEAFWSTVLAFFARHPMIDAHQVGPICDYLNEQKFSPGPWTRVNGVMVRQPSPQPGLSMTHRNPAVLVAQVQHWHRELARAGTGRGAYSTLAWTPSGVPGLHRAEGTPGHQRHFVVAELLNGEALRAEGAAMRHCVATYAWSCQQGRTAIFSVSLDEGRGVERLLTAEVDLRRAIIVQVRGRANVTATPLSERIVRLWAVQAKLVVGPYAFGRGG